MKYLVVVIFTLFISCTKDYSCEECKPPIQEPGTNALIQFTGPVAADGCDWVLAIGSELYHPDQLPIEFQQNDLNVTVVYELTTQRFICRIGSNIGLPVIHIISIKK